MSSFKSKTVEQGTKFNANVHIEKPVVLLQPSKKYFTLTGVSYELTEAKPAKAAKPKASEPAPKPKDESHNSGL